MNKKNEEILNKLVRLEMEKKELPYFIDFFKPIKIKGKNNEKK